MAGNGEMKAHEATYHGFNKMMKFGIMFIVPLVMLVVVLIAR